MKKASVILVLWAVCRFLGTVSAYPVVFINPSPALPVVGQTVTFDGSDSDDPNGMIIGYSWTLPGQAFCISGINASIAKCKFNAPGTYTVSLTAEDDEGLYTTEDCQITVAAASNHVWYVRPDGSDDNDGSTDSSSGAFRTIQTAIDSAADGDEIRVYGGIYYEQLYLRNKDLQLYSYNPANTGSWELAQNAIIDANKQGTAVRLGGNEPNSCQIKGFTIRGGFPTGDSLALHLGFNDPNTLTLDSSGKGRDGLIASDPNRLIGYDGIVEGAMEFNGSNWIQIEDYKGVAGRHPRSCAMWVKTTTAGTEMVLVSWGKELTGQKWQLLIADSNEIALDVQNGRVTGTTSIHDGNWHHVAAVFEANGAINIQDVKLYVDGVQENTTCSNYVTTPPDVNTELDGDVYIGARDGSTPAYYTGTLDDVRIYSRAIKLSEIQQMADNPEPVAQWTLDAISGNTIADSSSNARTGTFSVASPTSTCSDGRMDNAISLQNNEYIRISGWNGIAGGNSWTFSGWVKTLPNPSFTQMVCTWGSSSTGQKWMLRVETTGQIAFAAWGGYVTGTTIVADGSWHHIAAVLDADTTPTVGEVQLYVDGRLETVTSTNPSQAISTTDAENVLIGTRYQSGSYYNYYTGGLDDIRIYDRALNRGQIQEMTDNIGLMAHWTLDETSSPSLDSSGSDINGTWNDSPTPSAEGYFKGALEFEGEKTVDGKKDYVSTSYCGVIGTRDRTVSAWIKAVPQTYTTEAPALRSIISWGGTATGSSWNLAVNYVLNQGPYGTIRLAAGGSKIVATTRVDDNRWHHVAAVFSNDGTPTVSDVQLYIDGKKEVVSYITNSALNTGTGSNVTIGATKSTTADQYFKGKIDDVRIYDQAFTEGELRQMYEESIGGGISGHGASASIQQCIIADNISAGNGGGIDFLNGFISQCDISNNSAEGDGGGLWGGNGYLAGCTIVGNQSLRGGGIFNYCTEAMIDQCLFEANCAKQTGGAIYNVLSDLVFKSCSFKGNSDLGLLPAFPDATVLSVLPDWYWESGFGGNGQYIEQDLSVSSSDYPGQTSATEYQIRWGQVDNNVTENKSGLGFTGYAPPIRSTTVNEPFEIGRLRHFNNPIGSGSAPTRVDIEITLALECGSQLSQSFTFSLAINETPNNSNLSDPVAKNWADRDFITFPVSYPSQLIEIEGRLYTLKIIGFQTEQGQLVGQFESPEHGTNTVYLWAQIAPPPADGAITNLASNIWVGNCVFAGNTSCSYGAALSNWACENVFVGNSTIAANHGEFCGGIYNHESNLTVVNSILWGNTDVDGLSVADKQLFSSGNGTISVTYSCIQDANSFDTAVYPGTGNIDNAPLFRITPTDGGDGWGVGNNDEYGNLYLSDNSPCIDAGTNVPVLSYNILTDIFGHIRRIDCPTITDTGSGTAPIVDMGAYEYGNNTAPVAVQDQASTSEGTAVVIDVLANDYDVDGDPLSIHTISVQPSHGVAVRNGNHILYTPAAGYFGSDVFTYRITDGVLESNPATVQIQIASNSVFVDAGPNQTIQLPTNRVYLDGLIQGLPSGGSAVWRVLSQPTGAAVVFDTSSVPAVHDAWDSWAGFSLPGVYILELGVEGQDFKDQVIVNVRPGINSGNRPPQVEAWATPGEITLPQGTTLNWTISDDGVSKGELTQEWSIVSGPTSGRVTFGPYSTQSRTTTVSFSMDGNYILGLKVSDGIDQAAALVCVTVSPYFPNNTPPEVDAGENQTVVLPVDQPYAFTHLGASVGDETATGVLTIHWSVLKSVYIDKEGIEREGNSAVAIPNPAELNPVLTFYRPGQYTLQLKADDGQFSATDTVVFTVHSGNSESSPIQIEAGPNQTITLPATVMLTYATVIETVTGLPYPIEELNINWRKVRGPGGVTFTLEGSSGNGYEQLNPEAVFTKPGEYDLELEVSTDEMKLADQIRIKVYPGAKLATAAHSSYFINEYGQVWAAGSNIYGQLGNGISGYEPNENHDWIGRGGWYDHYTYSPVLAGEQKLQTSEDVLTNICSIGGGWASSYALDYNGNVWSWGNNSFGQLGIGRENLRVDAPVNEPRKVLAGEQSSASSYLEDIVAISSTTLSEHVLAVDKQGGVWAWGYNYDGVLGNGYDEAKAYWKNEDDYGNKRRRRFPWEPFELSFIESTPVLVGSSSLALDAYINFDTSICYAVEDYSPCIQFDFSGNKRELAYKGSVSGVSSGNELFDYAYEVVSNPCMGMEDNGYAAFDDISGSGYLSFDPNYYGILENNPRSISFWIKNNDADIYSRGTVLSWGNPEVGGGLWEVRVESGHIAVYVDEIHCIQTEEVLESNSWNHIVVVFPENGLLLSDTRIYLTQEDDLLCPPANTIYATEQVVNTVQYKSCRIGASLNDDSNYNYYGCLDELQIYKVELSQEDIDHIHRYPYYTAPLKNIVSVSAGWLHSLALEKNDSTPSCRGRVYAWGDRTMGELGQGDDPVNRKVLPCCVKTGEQNDPSGYLSNIVAISAGCMHSMALEKYTEDLNDIYSGRVLAWGNGYVGIQTLINWNIEYQIPDDSTGSDYNGGRIGRGPGNNPNTSDFQLPVYVYGPDLNGDGENDSSEGYLENIIAISAGESHSMALDKDGHVWVWGDNTHGQLGVGNQSIVCSGFPVTVKAPQDYNNPAGHLGDPEQGKIIAIMAGPWHCLALDEYGEVWAWGASWAIGCGEPGYHGTFLPQKISYSQKVKRVSSGVETWHGDIRAAVDEAVEGDEIIVYPGVYNGFALRGYSHANPNSPTDPNVIIRSWNCDDPNENSKPTLRAVDTVVDIAYNNSTIKGFNISGGQYGIKLHNSSSLICNNVIKKNTEAGICCTGSANAIISHNIIGDSSSACKAGIECKDTSSVTLFDNLIKCNFIGVKIESNDAELWNNTIVRNRSQGVYLYANSASIPMIRNCIIWGNGTDVTHNLEPSHRFVNIDYCAIQKGQFVPTSLCHKAVIDDEGSAFADTGEWHYFPLNPAFLDLEATDPNQDDDPNNCINEGCPLPDAPWVQYLAQRDVESKRRIADSKIDFGANEYIAYAIEAGQDKAAGIGEILFMNDAVVYKDGTVSTDIWPYGVQWELLEKPADSEFFVPGQLAGLINPGWRFDIPGRYVFRMNLFDAQGAWVDSDVVTVTAELNMKIVPVSDVQLQYDADTGQVKAKIELQGTLRGIDPQAVQILWLVPTDAMQGPVSDLTEQDGAYHTSTSALFYLPGDYKIRLQLLDMQGDVIAEDVIKVHVVELVCRADAGPDITIPWQNNPISVPLSGRLLPYSVGNESYLWKYIEGPAGGLQFNPGSNEGLTESTVQNPQATFTKPGIYQLQFAVTNSSGCVVDDLMVIIDTKDIPLTAEAGVNLNCVLNNNAAEVVPQKAFVYPVENVSIQWCKQDDTPIAGATSVNSTLTFTQPGVYHYKLKATRGQETAEDTVQIRFIRSRLIRC